MGDGSGLDPIMKDFNQFIDNMELVDIPLAGRSFTWYRHNGSVKSRLDRALLSLEWFSTWVGGTLSVSDRKTLDDCPVILKNVVRD